MRYISPLLTFFTTILLTLWLNGNILIPGLSLPPLGKILNPADGLWSNRVKPSEYQDYTIHSPFAKNDIKVVYDERKVPHIYASTLGEALFAQGYVEGYDRTFQMTFINRLAGGTLSEVLGERTIGLDKSQRRKGLDHAARKTAKAWSKMTGYSLIEPYIAGVKLGMKKSYETSVPVEFKLLDLPPPEWDIIGSARVMKWMSDVLCGRSQDIELSNLRQLLGPEEFGKWFPEAPSNVEPVIPISTDFEFDTLYNQQRQNTSTSNLIGSIYKNEAPPGVGSNNWAIAPHKTAGGKTIYASDPHLQLTFPSVWYEVGIHTPEFNAYGVSIPGMPGLMMGFNDSIAWGETNVAWDVKDYFEIDWIDEDNHIYNLDGESIQAELVIEEIKVANSSTIYDTVVYTKFGPIEYEDKNLALRWLAHDDPDEPEFLSFVGAMQAHNYSEYLEKTKVFLTPAQNFGFAAANGDIALRVNGKFPALTEGDGRFIQDGSQSINDWQAFIPRDQNPQVYNPSRGYVSSANQRSTGESYPYYYTGRFEHYRNRTLNDLLNQDKKFSLGDMKNLQANSYSKKAEEAMEIVGPIMNSTLPLSDELSALQNWNYHYDLESMGAAIFEEFFKNLSNQVHDEIYSWSDSFQIMYPESWVLIDLMKNDPSNALFDIVGTDNNESLTDIIKMAWDETLIRIEECKTQDLEFIWKEYQKLDIYHLARITSFSEMGVEVSGHPDALNAIGSTYGPSWRMIVELGDSPTAYGVFPGGQSGNPFSPYYTHSFETWKNLQYHPLHLYEDPASIPNVLFTLDIKK